MTPPHQEDTPREADIAVIGMSGRFPGARSVDELWACLRDGVEAVTFFSDEELLAAGVSPELVRDPDYVKASARLQDIEWFDAALFGYTPREAELMDPQHRLFLECAYEALEDAGYDAGRYEGAIGVFGGAGLSQYLFRYHGDLRKLGLQAVIANDKDFLATRVSYKLNLRGPSLVVQTACSTSLVAVHLACQSLLAGECDMALAGGVSIKLLDKSGYRFQDGGIMSPDGHCRAFDASARGTVNGDGVGLVLLKPLSAALADGDTIHAVVKGSAINNDGSLKAGYTAPSVDGQARAISEALAVAGVEPRGISYIEAHGTGTPLGDPIEISALASVFRGCPPASCAIGSLKTNIGHLDPAAGIAGFIKTVLALRHAQLPPSLHFERPNAALALETTPFYVNTRLTAWTASPRRAGVSSFGIGGTNAHVILEQAPARERSAPTPGPHLLVLSARSAEALEAMTTRLGAHLEAHADIDLADAAYTLQIGRRVFPHRCALVCENVRDAVDAIAARPRERVMTAHQEDHDRPVVFMFPGQGAQRANMARALYDTQPAFRADVDDCAAILRQEDAGDLLSVLFERDAASRADGLTLDDTRWTQPALFTIEYALARWWMRWGIRPAAMIGHSLGEYVAACLADVFPLEEALRLVAARGRLMQATAPGAMASVDLGEHEVRRLLDDGLSIAAINGPALCTVAGPVEALSRWRDRVALRGIACRPLTVSRAFHSASMDAIIPAFARRVEAVAMRPPRIPYLSNLTGTWIGEDEATDPTYWCRHLREPVRFAAGLEALHAHPEWILLEVGPSHTLSALARLQDARPPEQIVLSSLPSRKTPHAADAWLLRTLGELWLAGAPVRWEDARWEDGYAGRSRRRVPLPAYPFERTRHWIDVPAAPASPSPTISTSAWAGARVVPVSSEVRVLEGSIQASAPSRRERFAGDVKEILQGTMGLRPAEIDPRTTFLELGADSLLLLQIGQTISRRFGVRLPFRMLLEEVATVEAVSEYLDREAAPDTPPQTASPAPVSHASPADIVTPPTAVSATQAAPADAPDAVDAGVISRLMTAQLRIISQQLDVLRAAAGGGTARIAPAASTDRTDTPAAPPPPLSHGPLRGLSHGASQGASPRERGHESYVAYHPIDASRTSGLDARQRRHIDELIDRYTTRTAGSKRVAREHRRALADSTGTAGFLVLLKELCYPIAVRHAEGAYVWDVDDNRYVDIGMGFGTLMFGHSPAFVMDAVRAQLEHGMQLGPQSPLTGEVAKRLCDVTGMERAAFCNSGTEAVMIALRLARTVTGRTRVAMFTGSYHGTFDGVLVRGERTREGGLRAVPLAPGVPAFMMDHVTLLRYGAPESLDVLRREAGTLAAVLVEPFQSRRPELEVTEFLRELRVLTAAAGTALIFDEVITGFRMHLGGVQALCGVRADIATYGKVLGSGMPIGAVAGTAAYMDAIDGGAWEYGDASYPRADTTYVAGTYFKHPLAMAAADAVLRHLQAAGPSLQEETNARTARLVSAINTLCASQRIPIEAVGKASMFRFVGPKDHSVMDLFYHHLMEKGVLISETRNCFVSTAHTDADVEFVLDAIRVTLRELDEAGFFPRTPRPGGVSDPHDRVRGTSAPLETTTVHAAAATSASGAGADRVMEITDAQRGLWVIAQLSEEHSRVYNQPIVLRMRGTVDVDALQRALRQLLVRHDALRTSFSEDGRHQRIASTARLDLSTTDLSTRPPEARDAALDAWLREQAARPFDLRVSPLMRASLATLAGNDHVLALTAHHIVIDGWSIDVLLRELGIAYAAESRHLPYSLGDTRQYDEYVRWQADTRAADALAEPFWIAQLGDGGPTLNLPTDHPRPPVQTHTGATRYAVLNAALVAELKQVSVRSGVTFFMTLITSWELLLHVLTGQDDLIVGTPSAGQSSMGCRDLVGFCVNMLPLRSRTTSETTFVEHARATKSTLLSALTHGHYPIGRLIKTLGLVRDPSRPPLVEAVFNMDQPLPNLGGWGDGATVMASPIVFAHFDLHVNVLESGGQAGVLCTYNSDLFEPATVDRWLRQYTHVLRAVAADPGVTVSGIGTACLAAELEAVGGKRGRGGRRGARAGATPVLG